jgi:hypothetical protein
MSVLKVNNIQNASGTDAISIGSDGSLSYPNIGRRNLIINGAMQVAQRGAGPVTISDSSNEGYQTVDRWYTNFNSSFSGAIQTSQSSDAPNGFANSLKVACTTTGGPDSASTDNLEIRQVIEAQNLQQLAYGSSSPEQITVSFWLKAVTYSSPISVTLYVPDSVEYATASVTPTTSWAKYSVTFNGSTTGAIDNNNGEGMRVGFVLAGTSDGTYAASSDQLTVSSTRVDYRNDVGNFFDSTSNELYITGVQLEVGSVATPFEHRSYGEELALCQRYYWKHDSSEDAYTNMADGFNINNTQSSFIYNYPVKMRTKPSLSYSGSLVSTNATVGSVTITTLAIYRPTSISTRLDGVVSGVTAGYACQLRSLNDTTAYIAFDAEL